MLIKLNQNICFIFGLSSLPLLFLFLFLLLFSVLVSCYRLVPAEIVVKDNGTELGDTVDHKCRNPCGFENQVLVCNDFSNSNPYLGLIMRNTNFLHQFALIYLNLQPPTITSDKQIHNITQQISVTLYSMKLVKQNGRGKFVLKQQLANSTLQISDSEEMKGFQFYGQKIQHLLGYYRQIGKQQNYLLLLHFSNPEALISRKSQPTIKSILINPAFNLTVLIIRTSAFIITLATTIIYIYKYRQYNSRSNINETNGNGNGDGGGKQIQQVKRRNTDQIVIQQKLVMFLSVSVIGFHDPFYLLGVIYGGVFGAISVVMVAQFVGFLFVFWYLQLLIVYNASNTNDSNGRHNRLHKPIVGLLVISSLSYTTLVNYSATTLTNTLNQNPFMLHIQQQQLSTIKQYYLYWLYINTTFCIGISVWLVIGEKIKLWRYYNLLLFNLYFVALAAFLGLGAGFVDTPSNGKVVVLAILSFSLYTICMQYMYTNYNPPNPTNLIQLPQNQLNDSTSQISSNQLTIQIEIESTSANQIMQKLKQKQKQMVDIVDDNNLYSSKKKIKSWSNDPRFI